ncbi:MAG: dihydropteroate synthase [Roseovarius sp.]|nr:dihydropteroate synthase [Roseovarius sp.]
MNYFRPIPNTDGARPDDALPVAGGWAWFNKVEKIERNGKSEIISAYDLPGDVAKRISLPRSHINGIDVGTPSLMGIINATPDSFSDGGKHDTPHSAMSRILEMINDGTDIIDVGGESTRPGALGLEVKAELDRVVPIIESIRENCEIPISIDTRKLAVAKAAVDAGANMVNDVSGFFFDPELARFCADRNLTVCIMHSRGIPETMQINPEYGNVALDVYDYLHDRMEALSSIGIPRSNMVADPGIGFGKTINHNLEIIRNLALFHSLGCPLMLGASRKGFIGSIGGRNEPRNRVSGSIAVTLFAIAQGVQFHRVHDTGNQAEAIRLWEASSKGMFA